LSHTSFSYQKLETPLKRGKLEDLSATAEKIKNCVQEHYRTSLKMA